MISHFGFDNRNARARIYGSGVGKQSLIGAADSAKYLVETLKEPLTTAKGARRTYRISGSDPTYTEIFEILERVTGKRYEVTYLDVESAKDEEAEAKKAGNVDAELSASHKLIQGRERTLVPQPWDNERFPEIQARGVEEVLKEAFQSERLSKVFGLE